MMICERHSGRTEFFALNSSRKKLHRSRRITSAKPRNARIGVGNAASHRRNADQDYAYKD